MFPCSRTLLRALPSLGASPLSRDLHIGILDQLRHRLKHHGPTVADLRNLPAGVLDDLGDEDWRSALYGGGWGAPAAHVAMGGCRTETVNRALTAMPDLRACSVEGVPEHGDHPIDLSHSPGLRCFETTSPPPRLNNARHVPVLIRPPGMPPSFLPTPGYGPHCWTEVDCIDGLRQALADDRCRLSLMPEPEMAQRMEDALEATRRAFPRVARHLAPFDPTDAQALVPLLGTVPSVLLPADLATAARSWEKRLENPASMRTASRPDLLQLQQLLHEIDDVVRCPDPAGGWRARSQRDLVTLTRLMQWVWPDAAAYVRPRPVPPALRARQDVAAELRRIWDYGAAPREVAALLASSRPLPAFALLQRLGLAHYGLTPRRPSDPVGRGDIGDGAGPATVV